MTKRREVRYTNPFNPKFYGTVIPNLSTGFLVVSYKATPRPLKRKFPPGYFVKILYHILKYDHGHPAINRDPVTLQEDNRSWVLDAEELTKRWSDISKHRIITKRHRRAKAFEYYKHLGRMGLLYLELLDEEKQEYLVQFPNPVQWTADKQRELRVAGVLSRSDLRKLNRQHHFGNVCSWDWLLPNKRRVKIHVRGYMHNVKSVRVCARTFATYARHNLICHSRAILGGACDFHAYSERPEKRKSIRDLRVSMKNAFPSRVNKMEKILMEKIRGLIEESQSTFVTQPISNQTAADYHGHSLSTEKRCLALADIINIVPQALVVGDPVRGRQIPRIKAIRERYGMQPLRFVPVRGQLGWYQPQLDLPNRFTYKKKYRNWAIYPQIHAGLYCRDSEKTTLHRECTELTVPQVTRHDSKYGREYGRANYVVLAASTMTLTYLGDEGSPEAQRALRKAGLKMWKGPFRRKKRVAKRGTHHKDRTRFQNRMRAEGKWRGVFSMDLVVPTQADLDRRVSPETLYRRKQRERQKALKAEVRRYGSLFLNDFLFVSRADRY